MNESRLTKGLETIRKVLDYATDSDQTHYNIMVWMKDSVDALLAGRDVEVPHRASEIAVETNLSIPSIPIVIETNPLVPEGEMQLCVDGRVLGRIVNCTIDCTLAEESK